MKSKIDTTLIHPAAFGLRHHWLNPKVASIVSRVKALIENRFDCRFSLLSEPDKDPVWSSFSSENGTQKQHQPCLRIANKVYFSLVTEGHLLGVCCVERRRALGPEEESQIQMLVDGVLSEVLRAAHQLDDALHFEQHSIIRPPDPAGLVWLKDHRLKKNSSKDHMGEPPLVDTEPILLIGSTAQARMQMALKLHHRVGRQNFLQIEALNLQVRFHLNDPGLNGLTLYVPELLSLREDSIVWLKDFVKVMHKTTLLISATQSSLGVVEEHLNDPELLNILSSETLKIGPLLEKIVGGALPLELH